MYWNQGVSQGIGTLLMGGKQAVRKRTRGRFYQDTGISAEYRWNEIL